MISRLAEPALCSECECLDLAVVALDLHRTATAFQGQHYSTRQLYCAAHARQLAAELEESLK